ncbi:hypothetical protein NUW58_g2890 [Xylaria curta]|uniref:Uncharacterized protein n=1 Tax=Xylaria curta TaxID=42375 RepID=A0ACC1PF25_9PEZI|nr:hypothetical protein NUW58_g2890 [Xylaria curta]
MAFTIDTISKCGRDLFMIDIILTIICIFALVLRFWSAQRARRKLFLDDYAVVAAFVSKTALTGTAFWGTFNGLGHHIYDLTVEQLTIQVKLLLVSEFSYLLSTTFIKLSMLCLYWRIYTTPTFRKVCLVVIGMVVAYASKQNCSNLLSNLGRFRSANAPVRVIMLQSLLDPEVCLMLRVMMLMANATVGFIPLFLTNCIPLSQYWDPKPDGWCRDTLISDRATVAVNAVLDFLVLALPLPVLWRLQMSVRDKLTVMTMFSFGAVTIALVFWRLAETNRTRGTRDWTDSLCFVGIIAVLEVYLGIIAVCIPTYGPLFNAYIKPGLQKVGALSSNKYGSGGTGKKSFLRTFGSTGRDRKPGGYSEFTDSIDRIVSNDDNSIKLTPSGGPKVVAECAFEPDNETPKVGRGHGGIHVQRDIEAIYHVKKGQYEE